MLDVKKMFSHVVITHGMESYNVTIVRYGSTLEFHNLDVTSWGDLTSWLASVF